MIYGGPRRTSKRPSYVLRGPVDLVGASATGKTTMLGSLIQENDPGQMSNFEEQRNNLMVHHQFQIGGRMLKFLDCSGNDRAAHLVKEWFARTQWVFVVYNLTDTRSYEKALTLVTEARQAGASVVLFANKFDVNQGKPVEVPACGEHIRKRSCTMPRLIGQDHREPHSITYSISISQV
eukprot:s3538_g1.t2